jgi:hypothetical protein
LQRTKNHTCAFLAGTDALTEHTTFRLKLIYKMGER